MRRFWAFLFASILLHLLLGRGLADFANLNYLSQKKTAQPIDVTLVPASKAADQRRKMDHVVLDAAVPKDLQIDSQEEANLLSQRRQRVKKQTVAQDFGMTQNSPVQTNQTGKSGSVAQKEVSARNPKTSKTEHTLKSVGDPKKVAGLILQTDPFSEIQVPPRRRGMNGTDLQNQQKSQERTSDPLNQRLQSLSMGDGGRSLINEKIPGVQSANITALNTNPYLFYSFYNRLVSQVRFHWENNLTSVIPSLSVMAAQRFPNREEWLSQISLYMDRQGRVIKVDVDKSSGLSDLDYAVVRAMYAGGPYRNPPTDMEEDGQIRVQLNFSLFWRPSVMVNRRDTQRGAEY